MVDYLFSHSITLFEETLYDANPDENLHVMLRTLGGDGETALRLVRQAQSRCKELTVIVPVEAKSAGTLFVLGADRVLMGPTSDLGPIDPQFRLQSEEATRSEAQWQSIWRMWAKYAALDAAAIYEGQTASQIFFRPPPASP